MKKFLPILAFFIMLISIPALTKAAELTSYPNVVNVSVYKSASLTLTPNNAYQLKNNDTGVNTNIPANTAISVKNNGTAITVSFTGVSQTSTSGFKVQELVSTTTSIAALSNGLSYRGSFSFVKNGSYVEAINYLDMEDYLKGVVPSEMPASWPKEALKAQAIAARSYAATSMGLTSTPSSQVYRGYTGEDSRSNSAIKETEGLLAKFAGKPIMAFFFSTSGGRTANYGDVWNSAYAKDYYVSVADPYENSPHSNWVETVPASTILKSFGFSSTTKLLDVSLKVTGVNGEVGGVSVKTSAGDKTIEGNEGTIRKLFPTTNSAHYYQIDSNWFTMTVARSEAAADLSVQTTSGTQAITDLNGQVVQTASGQITLDDSAVSIQTSTGVVSSDGMGTGTGEVISVTLNGKGWGHRIGMSQYGAKGYAEHGWTAVQIIQHYFQGTTVSK